ncbi:Zn(2)-C6 fungal-type DNA-binding domain [Phytophthora palmivora]|uniref:Zn(2)-C6 fungal-type DNA-binding domain n=1 Tax=Phytophthora palmivora TaxID=4796 RepID=A0A2P4Y6K4_9STRA|nr:Zn(2)-C6 fungal-type DNA-binding domain [Phytophthora palmivora]
MKSTQQDRGQEKSAYIPHRRMEGVTAVELACSGVRLVYGLPNGRGRSASPRRRCAVAATYGSLTTSFEMSPNIGQTLATLLRGT